MRNILLTIAYDGTNYSGWQIQPNGVTIQEKLERAFYRVDGNQVKIVGSGRTDARVHATGQMANVVINSSVPTNKIPHALNANLPEDIAIKKAVEVPMGFHARYDAIGKTYRYRLYLGEFRDPIQRNYHYHVKGDLELQKLRQALALFKGTYDFKGFMAAGSSVKSTIRTIQEVRIAGVDSNNLDIYLSADGFLYNMVRIIVGSIVDAAKGKITLEQLKSALYTPSRSLAGHTAPPQGLFLEKVKYPLDA